MSQSYPGKCQLTLTLGPRFPHQISIWALDLDRLSRVDLMWGRQPWWWTALWALITGGRPTSPNFTCRAGQKDWSRAGHCAMIKGCSSCSPLCDPAKCESFTNGGGLSVFCAVSWRFLPTFRSNVLPPSSWWLNMIQVGAEVIGRKHYSIIGI
jgi:hypothetical protein